jgi:hypothetical protein
MESLEHHPPARPTSDFPSRHRNLLLFSYRLEAQIRGLGHEMRNHRTCHDCQSTEVKGPFCSLTAFALSSASERVERVVSNHNDHNHFSDSNHKALFHSIPDVLWLTQMSATAYYSNQNHLTKDITLCAILLDHLTKGQCHTLVRSRRFDHDGRRYLGLSKRGIMEFR